MSKPLLTEAAVERAVLLQSEEACDLRGAARAEYEYWCDEFKAVEARLIEQAPKGAVEAKRSWARSQPEYNRAMQLKQMAASKWFSQQEAGNAAQRILDVWRTLKADARRSTFQ